MRNQLKRSYKKIRNSLKLSTRHWGVLEQNIDDEYSDYIVTKLKKIFTLDEEKEKEEMNMIEAMQNIKVEYNGHNCDVKSISISHNPLECLETLDIRCEFSPFSAALRNVYNCRCVNNRETSDVNDSVKIKKVIFNPPATIVLWKDGTKTVVKAVNEEFDPEKGMAMAIAKKVYGNKADYFNRIEKWTKKYKTTYVKTPIPEDAVLEEAPNPIKEIVKAIDTVEKRPVRKATTSTIKPKVKTGAK